MTNISSIAEIETDAIDFSTTNTYDSVIDFNKFYLPSEITSFKTMVPLYLYINEKEHLTRIQPPSITKTGDFECRFPLYDNHPDWKLHTFWVLNISNVPPVPNSTIALQSINNKKAPYTLTSLTHTGIVGNAQVPTSAFKRDHGLFSVRDPSWRFLAYNKPIANTVKLYIYDTNFSHNVATDKKPSDMDTGRPRLYVTPKKHDKLLLTKRAPQYIWVCDKEYTRFICPNAIIIPSLKGYGYFSAIEKAIKQTTNWIKYKSGGSNTLREKLHQLNYNTTVHPWWEKNIIITSILLITLILLCTFYRFKK